MTVALFDSDGTFILELEMTGHAVAVPLEEKLLALAMEQKWEVMGTPGET